MPPTRLHCGRCGRVVARLSPNDRAEIHHARLSVNPNNLGARPPSDRPETRISGPKDRRMVEANYELGCSPKRCGATFVVNRQRLRIAMRDNDQRDSLIIGEGSYATANGGPDL